MFFWILKLLIWISLNPEIPRPTSCCIISSIQFPIGATCSITQRISGGGGDEPAAHKGPYINCISSLSSPSELIQLTRFHTFSLVTWQCCYNNGYSALFSKPKANRIIIEWSMNCLSIDNGAGKGWRTASYLLCVELPVSIFIF